MQWYLNFHKSYDIESISSGPPFLKSCVLLHTNVFTGQSPTFPTIKPMKIYTFKILLLRLPIYTQI